MKTPLKNLRIYATHVLAKAYLLTLCMARSNLVRQVLLMKYSRISGIGVREEALLSPPFPQRLQDRYLKTT
jgi:hypothetical protein